jgi:sugar (pentulose or hexulose) kinase
VIAGIDLGTQGIKVLPLDGEGPLHLMFYQEEDL